MLRLEDVRSAKATRFEVRVDAALLSDEKIKKLADLLKQYPGNCAVTFTVTVSGQGEATLRLPHKVAPSDDLLAAADRLLGAKAATVR